MKAIKIILVVIVVVFLTLLGFYTYYGGFAQIDICIEEQGGETVVYKQIIGDYSKTGEAADEIYYSLLNDYKIETYKGFGVFYDNPKNINKDKLRSNVGCVIEDKDISRISGLENKYKVKTLPKTKYIVAEFPYKGMMSIIVGLMKVYPALEKYAVDNNIDQESPVTEIYDVPNEKIVYRTEYKR